MKNTVACNEQTVKRLALRSSLKTFANVIADETSYSKFEAAVIAAKRWKSSTLGAHTVS